MDEHVIPVYIYKYNVTKGKLNMVCVSKYIHEEITFEKATFHAPGLYRVILKEDDSKKAIECIKADIESTVANLRKIEKQLDKLAKENE